MKMFEDENELRKIFNEKKELILKVASNQMSIHDFFEQYDSFYFSYCLNGFESDEEEKQLFEKYKEQISFFHYIDCEIFHKICSDENSILEIYIINNRISAVQAIKEVGEYIRLNGTFEI